jgi:hypothetical protein
MSAKVLAPRTTLSVPSWITFAFIDSSSLVLQAPRQAIDGPRHEQVRVRTVGPLPAMQADAFSN